MKKILIMVLAITISMSLAIFAYATNTSELLIDDNGVRVTQDEYDLAKKTRDFYESLSVTVEQSATYNTNDAVLDALICKKSIGLLFTEKNISLTSEETDYVNNYCKNSDSILEDMVANGNPDEKENALAVLQIESDERSFCGLTKEESDARETEEVAYLLKLEKLVDEYFDGEQSNLVAHLNSKN